MLFPRINNNNKNSSIKNGQFKIVMKAVAV